MNNKTKKIYISYQKSRLDRKKEKHLIDLTKNWFKQLIKSVNYIFHSNGNPSCVLNLKQQIIFYSYYFLFYM